MLQSVQSTRISLASLLSFFVATAIVCAKMCGSDSSDNDYMKERASILQEESRMCVGGRMKLTNREIAVNEIILSEKQAEFTAGHSNITKFLPALHFFQAKSEIEKSKIFSMLERTPKGASLHTHLLAGVQVDYIMEDISRRDNLYGCNINGVFKLRFMESPENDTNNPWKSIETYRSEDPNFDIWLRDQFSLEVTNPEQVYPTPETIWQRFKKIFTTEYDMMCYRPVFQDYIYRLLKELYLDNVFYTELRGTFMPLYELDGTIYNNQQFFEIFIKTVENFKKQHPDFLGVRYIHSIYRGVTSEVLKAGLDELIALKNLYPDFIAGFDFVGYEEEGHQLVYYQEILQKASQDLKFFYHAGETNWYGYTDLNLVDAILLNTSRIGHGFGLAKHPVLAEMVKKKNIAIELCPISNQVLMLIKDQRNHPIVPLLANDFPVVICNDDPSIWGATGLSYDWYMAFMAMVPENAGIEVLKQFAINSIQYSAMEEKEKVIAMHKWQKKWQEFLESFEA